MDDNNNGEGNNNNKLTGGIKQIVKLKEIIHKWQHVTLAPKDHHNHHHHHQAFGNGGISPAITKRLMSMNSSSYYDSSSSDHEDGCQSPQPPHDVPRGYLAVYVGGSDQLRRFIIPTSYLSDPLFKVLLDKVEEEFGFDHSGGLTIPCEIETFKYLLTCMETHQKHAQHHTSSLSETSSPIEE